jgi:hypothetical protein
MTTLSASQRLFVSLSLSLSLWNSNSCSPFAAAAEQVCTVEADGSSTCVDFEQPECGVYMAPSTLGEDTNMGIYTGTALRPNDVVNFPEIAVPLQFREWGEHREGFQGMSIYIYIYVYCVFVVVCIMYLLFYLLLLLLLL